MPSLAELQRWMALLIRDPDPVAQTLRRAELRSLVPTRALQQGDVIRDREGQGPIRRLEVYAGAYRTRLRRALRADFPALSHALGTDSFDHLVDAYLAHHPSDHPNLNALGRRLPGFVAHRRSLPHPGFCRELAELEWALVEAFHAPSIETPDLSALGALPESSWPELRFEPDPSLRLLLGHWPTDAFLQAVLDDQGPELPKSCRNQHLAVYRQHGRVHRRHLSPDEFATLSALASGAPLGAALAYADPAPDQVGAWFTAWSERGLLAPVG